MRAESDARARPGRGGDRGRGPGLRCMPLAGDPLGPSPDPARARAGQGRSCGDFDGARAALEEAIEVARPNGAAMTILLDRGGPRIHRGGLAVTEGPPAAFVTGGSGFIGGRLIERLVARRDGRCGRWPAPTPRPQRCRGARRRAGARRPRRPRRRSTAGAAGADVAFHLAAHLGEWGPWEDFERGNVEGTENALARLRRGRRAALRPLRHRGGADGRRAARPRRRDGAAAARLAGALPGDQGAGRAGRARRQPRRLRDRRRCARASSGARATRRCCRRWSTTVEAGKFGLGRRRPQRHRHRPRRQRRRGPGPRAPRRARRARPTSSPTASRSSSASSSPRCCETQGVEPPDRSLPAWTAAPMARVCEAAWRLLPLRGEPPMTRSAPGS